MTVETTQRGQRTDVAPTDLARVAWAVNSLEVETPSWGYGDGGVAAAYAR
jgi:L-rhamnose isomerase